MSEALIKIALPLALWLLTMFFEGVSNEKESKKRFLLFVDAVNRDGLASTKLHDDDAAQLDELKRRRENQLHENS